MKLDKPTADRSAYYADAASWAADVHGALRASRRLAWTIAGVAAGVAALEAVALATLVPLKTVVPYTITVDRQTGYIETAQGLKPGALSQDQAVTQAFLAQYVMARESVDASDIQANYRKVTAWSQGDARRQYMAAMDRKNPQSPVNLYNATNIVQTVVKSISLLSANSALVRFETARADGDASGADRRPYAAVIGFRYTGAPMRNEDRLLNPLGFQVTSYRKDSETLGSAPLPAIAP